MRRYPIFAIMALAFIGITKLLQVTVFDAQHYGKLKEMSDSKVVGKKDAKKKSGKAQALVPAKGESQETESNPSPVLDKQAADSLENTEEVAFNEVSSIEEEVNDYAGLSDLKNSYLAPIIARIPAGQLREDVVIRYYRHDKDGDKVYSLREIGYYIHEKEATETAGLGSNILYYGEDVAVEDIKIVAFTLLDQGLPLKAIEPTQFDWKSTSIEVGTDTLLLNDVTLTSEDIQNFRK